MKYTVQKPCQTEGCKNYFSEKKYYNKRKYCDLCKASMSYEKHLQNRRNYYAKTGK